MKSRGAVACGHAGTAEAAVEVLRAGGNAADAAVAAFFAACVFEPVLASPGGGGFAMCRLGGESPRLLDFFTETPRSPRAVDDLDFRRVTVDFGDTTQDFHVGLGAAATPGAVRGMFALHGQFGRVPMRELVEPALAAARRRPPLCALQARILKAVAPIYIGRPSARAWFESPSAPGEVLREGDPLRADALAMLLDALALEGEDLFYRGEVAGAIHAACQCGGGALGREDLARYQAHWRRPLVRDYRGARTWLNPPPAAGGILVALALAMLDAQQRAGSEQRFYEMLAVAMQLADDAWRRRIEAGEASSPLERLLDEDLLSRHADTLARSLRAWRGTTHFSVVDADGGMVAMTVSNGEGCGEIIDGTGMMLNNMLGEEDLNPAGFHAWLPATRMSSMMAPTLVELPNDRRIVLGSGGSNRIRSAVLQVIAQRVERDMPLEAAIVAPRIHVENDHVSIEDGIHADLAERLAARFASATRFAGTSFFFGGVHGVECRAAGTSGGGDPRRDGVFVLA